MSSGQANCEDAKLVLELYDLRRETVMREARTWVATHPPTSIDELMSVVNNFGSKENAYVRQVYGYWEMVASLIVHGTLNAKLAHDTQGEMYFVYALIQPYISEMRKRLDSPEFLQNLQKVIESTEEGRDRLARTQKRIAEFAKRAAASAGTAAAKQGAA
ncbi:MAG TPA: hypothetical protein VKB58_09090 [Terriglobales bacterium]|jgi:hypothetical protein|nr:hypothetical protein [Terriglobales bacterium]